MEIESLKKKNKILISVLVIILLLALVVSGYYVFTKYLNKESNIKEEIKEDEKKPEINLEEEREVFNRIKTIIEEELYVYNGLKKLGDLTPKMKAFLAIDLYCEKSDESMCKHEDLIDVQSVKASDLKSAYMNSSLRNYDYQDTSIPCLPYNENPDHYAWTFNSNDKTYNYTEIGHGGLITSIVDKKLISERKENNQYIVSYKYLWTLYGDFEEPIKLYTNYEDASEMKNPIATVSENFNLGDSFETYAKDTYILDSIDTYTYTFELVNNGIILKDFNRN